MPRVQAVAENARQNASMHNVQADLRRALEHHEGSKTRRWLLALSAPGTHAMLVYRLGRWALGLGLARLALDPLYHVLYLLVRICWGIEIPRAATIGGGLYIGHFGGINVSRRALLGRNCTLSQGVTIGVSGQGAKRGAPVMGDDVYIGPGARVFGPIRIGDNVKIGPNAVVHEDIPANAVVVLEPGFRIVSYRGNRRVPSAPMPDDRRRSASIG
jgi:serine O-acetyltransferase